MTVLQVSKSIIMLPDRLLNDVDSGLGGEARLLQKVDGRIEDVENIMQARHWSEVDSVRIKVLTDEAWKQMKV